MTLGLLNSSNPPYGALTKLTELSKVGFVSFVSSTSGIFAYLFCIFIPPPGWLWSQICNYIGIYSWLQTK
jgi:hypothetical protein